MSKGGGGGGEKEELFKGDATLEKQPYPRGGSS